MKYGRSQQGTSLGMVFAGVLLVIVAVYVISAFVGASKTREIKDRVNGISFSNTIEYKQCGGGGVDTSEWCTYEVDGRMSTVVSDLKKAEYTISSESNTTAVLKGGTPTMTIYLTEGDSTTSLEAKILEDGRTI